jgi:hypothetical protein
VTGAPIETLTATTRAAALRFRDDLLDILDGDLIALWVHGGRTFRDASAVGGDLDICAVVDGLPAEERSPRRWNRDPTSRPARVRQTEAAIAKAFGLDLDTTYLLGSEVGARRLPTAAFARSRHVNDWAIQRAHWHAGKYVSLYGKRPEDLALPPTTPEIRRALDRELEHLERHVQEGDAADPFEATYAIWNGCRILRSLATGDPVVSKRSAGAWGIAHLARRWHPVIRAAGRAYDGRATHDDRVVLQADMAPFVRMVRRHLPRGRAARRQTPRWS